MIRRTIHEWGSISYGDADNEIPSYAADKLAAVAKSSLLAGRSGIRVLEHGRRALRAQGVVGIIAASDCALEILPKIDHDKGNETEPVGTVRKRLVHMLAAVLDLKLEVGALTQLDWQRNSLLEILIGVFTQKLTDVLRQGMPRRYVECEEDLPSVRGRLDLARQFTTLAANPSLLACRFDALTRDIALNQIMKAAVQSLAGVARTVANQQRLRELGFLYLEVKGVPISALRWDEIVLDRTNNRWAELLRLAKMLLGQRFQTTSQGTGGGYSLLFEMNSLFEQYVARKLKQALRDTDLRVVSQGGQLHCLEDEDNKRLFRTRPDILIQRGDHVVQIIDTKWKRIVNAADDPKQGVSQGDVYQMMAYGQLYKCPRLTLLYPHHWGLSPPDGVHSTFRVRGGNHFLEVRTLDIATDDQLTDRLKALVIDTHLAKPRT
ncbi:McrC family protein [Pseudorhizobium marinum]|uniref:McrC family protein n=1 Tax=Pseudorhizobium marinum TaxID=1496690 RepID=UPI000496B47F|nr:McrBC 5-methylcytosine restriction system component [Pseudorhizobium marinum]